jgi:WD40 repeat protein
MALPIGRVRVSLAPGTYLGPYEIVEPLATGGMGQVYRARDPRLGRDVAVKLVATDGTPSGDRVRRFETEARAAAQLSHPNVVTVFDVGTHDGRPYLVLELLEGKTLREALRGAAPSLREAVGWGLEAARGLAAAHDRGIVHRDLKPENIFLTEDGRVKVLDFGLAKLHEPLMEEPDREGLVETRGTKPGMVLGTVGYMAPEQVRGETPDARTDVFALGTVLYELVTRRRPFGGSSEGEILAAILRDEPPAPSSIHSAVPPVLDGVVRRCLAKPPSERFSSAREVAAALETVLASLNAGRFATARPPDVRGPYPGLKPFRESDTERFFGREAEVEALWARLHEQRILAVIGPSGVGKTSFVRAGVLASRPTGWAAVMCAPGVNPFRSLGQALAPQLADDAEALSQLVGFDDLETALGLLGRWRRAHNEALVVVDQFEELFALSAKEEQARFAELIGRLATEADVHVVLLMRDDFLMRCSEHDALARVFTELTPLRPLSGNALRRALEEPAKREGFSFEEGLVEKMLQAVEGARGALPLLAFAVARLWEKRDRERKLLTRKAYEEIGGVAGALVQHAEQTLERIGLEKEPIVRELFRNLVTAQWTRAVADREELLSVPPDRESGSRVLEQLIDARLLTSYEATEREWGVADGSVSAPWSRGARTGPSDEGSAAPLRTVHRVEIVHESLLRAWPRLVWWQAQDEEGAVLRDQLRQAAHLWEEKSRSPDVLWSGDAFQEFELWRRRYPGKLTALENDFAQAMVHRAHRRKRLRRMVATSVVATATAVAAVTGVLWKRARDEALRAEAGKLLALGRNQLADDTTAALAYARGSIDLFDTPEARRFALEVLWQGPVARLLPLDRLERQAGLPEDDSLTAGPILSPDGRWLAMNRLSNHQVLLLDREGGPPRALPRQPDGVARVLAFGPRSDLLITGGSGQSLRMWSLPDLREVRTVSLGGVGTWELGVRGDTLFLVTVTSNEGGRPGLYQALTLPDGDLRTVGVQRPHEGTFEIDPGGTLLHFNLGGSVGIRPLGGGREQLLGSGERTWLLGFFPSGDRVAVLDRPSGEIRILPLAGLQGPPLRVLRGPVYLGSSFTVFDREGRRLTQAGPGNSVHLWDLDHFPDARPAVLGRPVQSVFRAGDFTPDGRWLISAVSNQEVIEFWAVDGPLRRQLSSSTGGRLAFTADGRWLATCAASLRLLPVRAKDGGARDLGLPEVCSSLATHPRDALMLEGTVGLASGGRGAVLLHSLAGGSSRELLERSPDTWGLFPVAFDSTGGRALASQANPGGLGDALRILHVWALPSGRERVYSVAHLTDDAGWPGFRSLSFAPDGSLYGAGKGGVRRLRLPEDPGGAVSSETVYAAAQAIHDLSRDGRLLLVGAGQTATLGDPAGELLLFDLEHHSSQRITTHGARISCLRLSPSGRTVVTGDADGTVRVGPATGEEPRLMLGHKGRVKSLAISPDERWIASASDDTLYVWPMPDVTQPPLHTLPHAELLEKLDALTNLRVVRDPTSATGWTLEIGPFPGWKDVPTW